MRVGADGGTILTPPQCLALVLDNALSHPVLEKLLPTLKYSLHDSSEKVRTAFLDMLIKVKAVRAAKVTSLHLHLRQKRAAPGKMEDLR